MFRLAARSGLEARDIWEVRGSREIGPISIPDQWALFAYPADIEVEGSISIKIYENGELIERVQSGEFSAEGGDPAQDEKLEKIVGSYRSKPASHRFDRGGEYRLSASATGPIWRVMVCAQRTEIITARRRRATAQWVMRSIGAIVGSLFVY